MLMEAQKVILYINPLIKTRNKEYELSKWKKDDKQYWSHKVYETLKDDNMYNLDSG